MIRKSFKTSFVTTVLIVMGVLIAQDVEKETLVGKTAPKWALKTSDGKFEYLKNYTASIEKKLRKAGDRQVIVQSFFASWCVPCIKEIGELHKLKTAYAGKPVQFFLVDLTDYFRQEEVKKYREAPDAMAHLQDLGLTDITVLEDKRGIVARKYKVNAVLPRLFVIDKYQTVQMDEAGLCSICIENQVSELLDRLIEE